MTAILRVKRKNTNAPLDSVVIACKRLKTSSDASPVETVLQFAGTLTDPTEDVTKHVAKILDTENHKVGVKRESDSDYPANISGKIPKWIHVDSVTEKRKIIDCQRSQGTSNEEEFKDKWLTLIDIEDRWSSTNQDMKEKEDIEDYVYDLYYAQTSDDIWFDSDNILVRRPEYSDVEFQSEDDSEDSNAESHWKNDYPDTDPDRSSEDSDLDESDYSDDSFERYSDRLAAEYEHMRKKRIWIYPSETDSSDLEENGSEVWIEDETDNEETSDNEE